MFTRNSLVRALSLSLVLLTGSLLTGCNDQLKTENDGLKVQNQELQNTLDQERKAREMADKNAESLASQIAKMQSDAAGAKPVGATATKPANGAKAAAIEDFGPGVTSKNTREGVNLNVTGDILFSAGQATLKPSAKTTLARIAKSLKTTHAGHAVRIEGHTDTDKIVKSKWASNQQLSLARADAVKQYLASQGVTAGRMSTVGHGSDHPKASKALSRRVEIIILN